MNPISSAALKRLQVLYRQADAAFDLGNGREDRLRWASDALGRPVASFSLLNASEGKRLIDALQASLGVPETAPPRRQRLSRYQAEKLGTEGRRDQIHAETTMLDGTEEVFRHIQLEMSALGWDETRLRAFLRSGVSPTGGRERMLTLADANSVHWALKRMAERAAKKGAAA